MSTTSRFHGLLVFLLLGKRLIFLSSSSLSSLFFAHKNKDGFSGEFSDLHCKNASISATEMVGWTGYKKEARLNQHFLSHLSFHYIQWQSILHTNCGINSVMYLSVLHLLPFVIITFPLIPAPEDRGNNHFVSSVLLSEIPALNHDC